MHSWIGGGFEPCNCEYAVSLACMFEVRVYAMVTSVYKALHASRAQHVRTHSVLILDDGELRSVPFGLRGRLFAPLDLLFRLV